MNENSITFDSSLFDTIDKSISPEDFKSKILELLPPILEKRFQGNKIKQQIRPHIDRITFSCPYCGDSMETDWKQRGNIILKSNKYKNHFKCFNCGTFKRVDEFFEDFNTNLQLDVINYVTQNRGDFSTSFAKYDISLLLDIKAIEDYSIDREEIKNKFNLIEAKGSIIWSWLNNRLQFDEKKYLYSPLKNYILIFNFSPSGKILGFQKRNFGKFQTKYLTYNLSLIYGMLGKTEKVPEEIDSLSQLFGICFLDFNRSIILLEGPLDSFLIRNSIANGGANKNLPIDIPVKYLYDKDPTGIKKSIQHINNGEDVFLWEKFLRDINAPYRKKWDITDIYIWAKENNIRLPNILNYFSKEPLDIVDI
jgi:hypothetical protein